MLWFNFIGKKYFFTETHISIHLMLWFNVQSAKSAHGRIEFQYILCCGSTMEPASDELIQKDFNTSYVVVQPRISFSSSLIKLISIHLMLWFNLF